MPAAVEELEIQQTEEIEEVEGEEKTYTFDELPDNIKSDVLDKHRHMDVDDGFEWWDCVYDDWKEKLTELGFNGPDIYFSGFWSQGDGACFLIKGGFDIKAFSQHHKKFFARLFFPNINKYLNAIAENITFSIRDIDSHYSHEHTKDMDWDYCTGSGSVEEELGTKLAAKFEDKVVELAKYIEEERVSLCKQIYRELEEEYDHLTSDEYIKERIEDYEYRFDEFGDKVE